MTWVWGWSHLCFPCRNKLPAQSGQQCQPLLHLAGNPSSPSTSASCPARTHSVRRHKDEWWHVTKKDCHKFKHYNTSTYVHTLLTEMGCKFTLSEYSCYIRSYDSYYWPTSEKYRWLKVSVVLVRFLSLSMLSKVHVAARLHTVIHKTCRTSTSTLADFS